MCEALMELMKPEFDAALEKAVNEKINEAVNKAVNETKKEYESVIANNKAEIERLRKLLAKTNSKITL